MMRRREGAQPGWHGWGRGAMARRGVGAKPAARPSVGDRMKGWYDRLSPEQKARMKSWGEGIRKRVEEWRARMPKARGEKAKPPAAAPRKPARGRVRRPKPAPAHVRRPKPAPKRPVQPKKEAPKPPQHPQMRQRWQSMRGGFGRATALMREKDKNKDGKLDLKEFGGPAEKFKQADADKDGFVTLRELIRASMVGAPGRGPWGGRGRGPGRPQ